ncbi:TPA_asm: polyprotein [Ananas comosus secovirus]|uniref:RNA1 polyprotein n=1 Tax=Ananas comosus secovirus TaxID=2936685 RepID=A0A9N6YJT9_9SECO|nr:TPA_asm: polyprotein [Ananas comosus secovirus]
MSSRMEPIFFKNDGDSSFGGKCKWLEGFAKIWVPLHVEEHPMHGIVGALRVANRLDSVLQHSQGYIALESPAQWFMRAGLIEHLVHPDYILSDEEEKVHEERIQGALSSLAGGFLWQLGNKIGLTALSTVGTSASNFTILTTKLIEVVDKILGAFSWISDMVSDSMEFMAKIKERIVSSIQNAFSKIRSFLDHFAYLLPLICGVLISSCVFFIVNKLLQYVAPSYSMNSFRLIEILMMVGAVVGIKEVTQYFLSYTNEDKINFVNIIRNFFRVDAQVAGLEDQEILRQSVNGTNVEEHLQDGLLDLSVFGSVIACISLFMDKENKEWLQRISFSSALVKNTYDGFDKCSKIVASIAEWLYTRLGNSKHAYAGAAQSLLLHTGVGIHEWLEGCDEIIMRGDTQQMRFEEVIKKTRSLLDQGKKIADFLLSTDDGTTFILRQRFLACDRLIREFYARLVKSKIVNQYRETPFVTVFYGPPGTGKSTVSRIFAEKFLDEMGEPKCDRVYARNPGDAYWSSYIRQPMVLFDDFAQTPQSNGMFDEACLIPLVSCNPYLLPMAAVEEKGRPFDSKYITLCTNRIFVSEMCDLADCEAFYRRRHVFWKVEINPNVPYNPARCYDNLLFSLQDSLRADLPHPSNLRQITFFEMLAHTVNQAQTFRENEMRALASIKDQAMDVLPLARMREAALARNNIDPERVQALPIPHSVFTITDDMKQMGYTYPNFDSRWDAQGKQYTFLCLGDRAFFDDFGNSLEFIEWADSEILVSQEIERKRNLWDLVGARYYLAHINGIDRRLMDEFLSNIKMKEFVESEGQNIIGKSDTVGLTASLREFWSSLSDALRYLLLEQARIDVAISKISTWQDLREALETIGCVKLWNSIPVWVKWTLGILSLFAGGCALYLAFSGLCKIVNGTSSFFMAALFGHSVSDVLQATSSGGDERVARAARRNIRGFRVQSNTSENIAFPGAWSKCERARVAIEGTTVGKNFSFATIYGVMIAERTILIPTHYLMMIDWNNFAYLRNGNDEACSFFCSEKNFTYNKYGNSERVKFGNMALIKYSPLIRSFECYPHLEYERATNGAEHWKGYIMSNLNDLVKHDPLVVQFERNLVRDEIAMPSLNLFWRNDHTFMTKNEGKDGMCGRIALAEKNGTLVIQGLHCFGRSDMSRFCDIPLEFQERENVQSFSFDLLEEKPVQLTHMVSKVGFLEQGAPKLSKSQIEKSPIFEDLCLMMGPPKVEPTVLSPMDPRPAVPFDPYAIGIQKFQEQAGPFDFSEDGFLMRARDNIMQEWEDARPDSFPIDTVCSLEVAIQGVDGLEYAEALPISTAEGFPYCMDRKNGQTGKERFFSTVNGKRVPLGDWVADVEQIEHCAATDPPEIFTVACAKDEKTKLAKVYDAPKTRIFEILPFTFNLVIRKYFLFWMQWMMKNHMRLPCKVGLNPYSFSWDDMAAKHTAYANHFCGDYSGFDTNTNVQMGVVIADMISALARDGNRNRDIRRNLIVAAMRRKVIVGREVFFVDGGTPSGFALTVMINSVMNELYLKMSWFALARQYRPELSRDADLKYHVCMSIYGDDNVVSMTSHVVLWYNLETISKYLSQFGVRLTDGQKSGKIVPTMAFEDIDFLKRKWVKDEVVGWFRCPLDKVSIESQLYWIKHSDDNIEALKVNVDNALRESAQHSREYFDYVRNVVVKCLRKGGHNLDLLLVPTYQDCLMFWKMQRSSENLPLHYDDPLTRVRFLATREPNFYSSFYCSTARAINKSKMRSDLDNKVVVFVTASNITYHKKKMKAGAFHFQTSLNASTSSILAVMKDALDCARKCGSKFTDQGKEAQVVILSDSEFWISQAIGIACAISQGVSALYQTVWVSGLEDRAYKFFLELHGEASKMRFNENLDGNG